VRFGRDWVLPPAVDRAVTRAVRKMRPVPQRERQAIAGNGKWHGAFRGRRCFVIANGPSLATENLDVLGAEITIVMNEFNRHHALAAWTPTFHCAAEPATFYRLPGGREYFSSLLRGFRDTVHVFPVETMSEFDRDGSVPASRLLLVKQDGRPAADFSEIDLADRVPAAHDTSILAVSLAIALGCDPIVILGLDYDWLGREDMQHFYADPEGFALPVDPGQVSYPKLPYLAKMRMTIPRWEAHEALRRIAERTGQRIINATPESFLDVYPRSTLAEVLADSGSRPA